MPTTTYATIQQVRDRTLLSDTYGVPDALITDCLAVADRNVKAQIRAEFQATPPADVVSAEIELATARILIAVAGKEAFDAKTTFATKPVSSTLRFEHLCQAADRHEATGWALLDPYCIPRAAFDRLIATVPEEFFG